MSDSSTKPKIVILIQAHPDLADLIPGYLESRRLDLVKIRRELAQDNYAPIAVVGHRMRGTGSSYGFDGLSEIGSQIEAAAKASQSASLGEAIQALEEYLDSLQVNYSTS